ncbi:hypothetical protein SCG7086_BV_00070 [Chlamydiales bacterium SCGC AG-110-P3]|nr:hypothetical protein SCG7086_BV_00070 [Chlamydiales bacterium SCGC AG-110-P3]
MDGIDLSKINGFIQNYEKLVGDEKKAVKIKGNLTIGPWGKLQKIKGKDASKIKHIELAAKNISAFASQIFDTANLTFSQQDKHLSDISKVLDILKDYNPEKQPLKVLDSAVSSVAKANAKLKKKRQEAAQNRPGAIRQLESPTEAFFHALSNKPEDLVQGKSVYIRNNDNKLILAEVVEKPKTSDGHVRLIVEKNENGKCTYQDIPLWAVHIPNKNIRKINYHTTTNLGEVVEDINGEKRGVKQKEYKSGDRVIVKGKTGVVLGKSPDNKYFVQTSSLNRREGNPKLEEFSSEHLKIDRVVLNKDSDNEHYLENNIEYIIGLAKDGVSINSVIDLDDCNYGLISLYRENPFDTNLNLSLTSDKGFSKMAVEIGRTYSIEGQNADFLPSDMKSGSASFKIRVERTGTGELELVLKKDKVGSSTVLGNRNSLAKDLAEKLTKKTKGRTRSMDSDLLISTNFGSVVNEAFFPGVAGSIIMTVSGNGASKFDAGRNILPQDRKKVDIMKMKEDEITAFVNEKFNNRDLESLAPRSQDNKPMRFFRALSREELQQIVNTGRSLPRSENSLDCDRFLRKEAASASSPEKEYAKLKKEMLSYFQKTLALSPEDAQKLYVMQPGHERTKFVLEKIPPGIIMREHNAYKTNFGAITPLKSCSLGPNYLGDSQNEFVAVCFDLDGRMMRNTDGEYEGEWVLPGQFAEDSIETVLTAKQFHEKFLGSGGLEVYDKKLKGIRGL